MKKHDLTLVRRHDCRWPRYFPAAAWVIAAMLAASCAPKKEDQVQSGTAMPEEATPPPATPSPGAPAGEFSVDGTILKLPVEGSCWVIRTFEGTQYEPTNLADDYRAEGTRVRALLRARSDMASACGVGTVVEIANIERME
jgi:hypothetical protein